MTIVGQDELAEVADGLRWQGVHFGRRWDGGKSQIAAQLMPFAVVGAGADGAALADKELERVGSGRVNRDI
jgi:hypothetical protein